MPRPAAGNTALRIGCSHAIGLLPGIADSDASASYRRMTQPIQNASTMLDPSRSSDDKFDVVRERLARRGRGSGRRPGRLSAAATSERRAADSRRSEKLGARARRPSERSRRRRSGRGEDVTALLSGEPAARPTRFSSVEAAARSAVESRAPRPAADAFRTCRTRACRRGRARTTTSRCAGTASRASFDFDAEAALGARAGARHPRLRARREDVGRALRGAARRRRAARARAHQLHARPAHARARLSPRWSRRSSSTRAALDGHGQPAEVRGRPVQDRRRLGSVS